MTHPTHDGPQIFTAAADPSQAPQPAPFGPFRRAHRASGKQTPPGPGFGLLAVDPEAFSRGRRRLKLRHAAMATGAFAMLSVATTHPAQEAVTRAVGLTDTQPDDSVDATGDSSPEAGGASEEAADAPTPAGSDDPATAGAVEGDRPDAPGKSDKAAAEKKNAEKKNAGKNEKKAVAEPWNAVPIAEFQGIPVMEISDAIQLVGFHEAAYNVALPLTPTDPPTANHGAAGVPFEKKGFKRSADLVILPTRLRDTAPNTALDVAVSAGAPIYAPIDGEVTAVHHYDLYGKYPDTRIEITPKGRPDLQLTVLHVSHPFVKVGDQLVAGETPFAGHSTLFPFESQIDRFSEAQTGSVHPHVHMEFKFR